MSFQTGYIALNAQPTNWQQVLTEWQTTNCAGEPVGDPVAAMQAVVLNKILVSVCNAAEIGAAIVNAQGNYITPDRIVLADGATQAFAANTYNSIAFKVISGSGTISIGADPAQTIDAGEADSWTATKLLDKQITITCTTGKIVITTLK